jgi:hypothetical protein
VPAVGTGAWETVPVSKGVPMKRLDPLTVVFLVLASAWATVQFVLAFFVHVTERAKFTSAGWVVPPTKTYMESYALSEVVLTAIVLGVVALVGFALHRRRREGEFGASQLAWGLSIATLLFGIVGFTYLFGVSVFLCLACASVRRRPSTEVQGPTAAKAASLG